jgi:hypothetical protein
MDNVHGLVVHFHVLILRHWAWRPGGHTLLSSCCVSLSNYAGKAPNCVDKPLLVSGNLMISLSEILKLFNSYVSLHGDLPLLTI